MFLEIKTLRVHKAAAALLAVILTLWVLPAFSQDPRSGERTVEINGVERSYLVHIPPHVAHPASLVFVFHGYGGNPASIARKTGMSDIADQNGFIAVFPAGARGMSSDAGAAWNIGDPLERGSSADDVAFVQAMLRDIKQTELIDPARVYAVGHSMGGMFAYRLACEMSGSFAAIAAVSATMVELQCRPHDPVAILHIHGTNDERIPINGGAGAATGHKPPWPAPQQGIATWRQLDSCAQQLTNSGNGSTSCTTYQQCRATVEYCVISGGTHPWPAGASDRVWAFFATRKKGEN